MWTFNAPKVSGCGIDSERIDRFLKWTQGSKENPPDFVFSKEEITHCRNSKDPAFSLCASFCAKEAFYKATGGKSFDFKGCELFANPDEKWFELKISKKIIEENNFSGGRVLIERNPLDSNEIIVILYLLQNDER